MRVLRTTPSFYPHVTGPAYQAYRISAGLERCGHSSPVVTTDVVPDGNPGYPPELDGEEFPFEVTRHTPLFSVDQYWFPPGAIREALFEEYDLIHAHSYFSAVKDVMYPVAQLLRDKPLVLHVHGSFGEATSDPSLDRTIQYRLYDAVFKRIATNAAAVVVSSRQEHREAVEFGVPEERIHTIPVGKDPETYTAVPFSPPTDRCRVLFVGRLAPRRNVEMLIEAVATLDRDDVELRIVGGEGTLSGAEESNYLDRLERTVTEFDAGDHVTFTGPQYGDDLVREFRSADVFANPTHYENFGQATLEAAFAGLPLVATPTGVAPELIEEEDTGRLVETATEMRAAINELADAPDRRRELGRHAQTLAREEYRWDRIVDQYESLYRSVLGA